jgi:hypothetical protein
MQRFDSSHYVLYVLFGAGSIAVVRVDAGVASAKVGLADLAHGEVVTSFVYLPLVLYIEFII